MQKQGLVMLDAWFTMSTAEIIAMIDILTASRGGREAWINSNPGLLIHPRDTCDERTLGVHQTWQTNLMPHREIDFHGRRVYLFDHHIEGLLA